MEYETNSRTFGFRRSPYSNRSKSRTSLTRRSKSKLEDIDLTSSIAEIYRKSKNRNSSNFHKKSIKDIEYTDKSGILFPGILIQINQIRVVKGNA